MHDSSVWEKRWQALEKTMAGMSKRYEGLPNPTYKALVECLQAFGASQFRFFNNGFQQGKLMVSMDYPVEHVLHTTLDQVADDISVIQRAVDQHKNGSSVMKATLDKADKLALDAINLAVSGDLLNRQKHTVITYFNKTAEVRVIPYAPVALVAVPFTAPQAAQDFLAIPHEVGHYVYRHTLGLAAKLHVTVPLQPTWQRNWVEEIFADVYGCLVAGPVIALDFQDLFLTNSLADLIGDDGEHPLEIIRPNLYIKILEELGFAKTARALKDRWAERLEQRGNPTTFVPYGEFDEVSVEEARIEMEETSVKVLDQLDATRQVRQNDPAAYWSQDLVANAELDSLYQTFAKWVNTPLAVTVSQLQDLGDKVGIVEGNSKPTNVRPKGATQSWTDDVKKQSMSNGSHELPESVWVSILSTGGWNTKGPDGWWP